MPHENRIRARCNPPLDPSSHAPHTRSDARTPARRTITDRPRISRRTASGNAAAPQSQRASPPPEPRPKQATGCRHNGTPAPHPPREPPDSARDANPPIRAACFFFFFFLFLRRGAGRPRRRGRGRRILVGAAGGRPEARKAESAVAPVTRRPVQQGPLWRNRGRCGGSAWRGVVLVLVLVPRAGLLVFWGLPSSGTGDCARVALTTEIWHDEKGEVPKWTRVN